MYCEKCGKQIEDGRQYCKSCGYNMANSSPNTYSFIQSERKKNEKNAIKHLKDEQNTKPKSKKRIIVILIVVLSVVSVIVGALLLMNINKKNNENKNTPQVNFDLSQYSGHGNLSCGLIWVKEYQWIDRLDGNYEMFAYFDVDGNQKSIWFNTREYFASNFKNNFLELEKVKLKYESEREHSHNYDIYDLKFHKIASVECQNLGSRKGITPFNEYGFAFADERGKMEPVFIDSHGKHDFSDDVFCLDINNIITTDKYFLVEGNNVCNHQGESLVDTRRIVENYIDAINSYSRDWSTGESDLFYINIGEIIDGKSIELEFNARNKTSQNMVVFNCKIDFNGNFIESPTKR